MVCSEFSTPKYSNFLYIRGFMDIIEQDFSLAKTKRLAVRIIGSREDASHLTIDGPDIKMTHCQGNAILCNSFQQILSISDQKGFLS